MTDAEVVEGAASWSTRFVARDHDTLHHRDRTWRFHRRTVS